MGIGANTAAFSVADAALLRPLPIADPATLVTITARTPQHSVDALSYPDFRDLAETFGSVHDLIGFRTSRFAVARRSDEVPRIRFGLSVTTGFFDVLVFSPSSVVRSRPPKPTRLDEIPR